MPVINNASIALDVLSLVFVLLIIFDKVRNYVDTPDGKRFTILAYFTGAFLLVDIAFRALEGLDYNGSEIILLILKTAYFVLNSLILFGWVAYVDYKIFHDTTALKKRITFYLIPFAINMVLLFINLFSPAIFEITAENTSLFVNWGIILYTALNYSFVAYYYVLVLINKKHITKSDYLPLLLFCIPAIIASVIQLIVKPLSLICGYAISLVFVYLHLQNTLSFTDGLTGIFNRRSLTEHLTSIFKADPRNYYLSCIMLDVDDLKGINDTYGHAEGDCALQAITEILNDSISNAEFLARYAGDEFMIICRSKNSCAAENIMKQIEQNRLKYNETSQKPYKISFSVGLYTSYDGECTSIDDFLKLTDNAMYVMKKQKHHINKKL